MKPTFRVATRAALLVAIGSGPSLANLSTADLPHAKPGLWEVKGSLNGRPMPTEHNCDRGEQDVRPRQLTRAECPVQNVSRDPSGGWAIDAVCGARNVSVKAHVVVRGDFHTHFITDSREVMTMGGRTVTNIGHMESHYVGPCV